MQKLISIIILTICSSMVWGQAFIKVSGSIHDSMGNPLHDSYLRVLNQNANNTIHYLSTGNLHTFSFTIQSTETDRLVLKIAKTGYRDTTVILDHQKQVHNFKITLKSVTQSLPEVRIESKPIWQNDDTTFYKLSAFSNGLEKNLGEVISKVPGFSIIDGTLLYKNKVVSKILIQGEDLFSEKQSLLLANFPADVIEHIQAMENQVDNQLLKGLHDGNKTIVNLTIKKKRIRGFGYVDAGINTLNKYMITPLYFSLLGNTKIALIGNRNTQGHHSSITQHDELKPAFTTWNERWMTPTTPFEQISDLDNRHFLRNNLWDARMKINNTIGKKIKSETEISYLNDTWRFDRNATDQIQADSGISIKKETRQAETRPEKMALQQKLNITIDRKSSLLVKIFGLYDRTGYNTDLKQSLNQISDTAKTNQAFKNRSLFINTQYTNRINDQSAIQIDFNFNNAAFNQNNGYNVNNLAEMLSVDPGFNELNVGRRLSGTSMNGKFQLIKRIKGKLYTPAILHESREVTIKNDYYFKDVNTNQPDSANEILTGASAFKTHQTEIQFQYGWGKKIRWNMNSKVGIYQLNFISPDPPRSKSDFIGNIGLTARFSKRGTQHNLIWSVSKQPLHPYQAYQQSYALSPVSIVAYFNSDKITTPSLFINYMLNRRFRNKHYFSALYNHTTTFRNFVYEGRLNRIFHEGNYTFKNKSASNHSISLAYMIPLKKRMLLDFEINAQHYANLISVNDLILKTFYNQIHSAVKIEKRWRNKHEGELSAGYRILNTQLPNELKNNEQDTKSHQYNVSGRYLYRTKMNISIEGNFKYLSTTSFTFEKSSLLISNLVLHYTKPNKPLQFSAYFDNLTNSKYYETLWSAFPVNGSSRIPLIKRNFMIRVRYNL
ncbi:MAG TPA: hypothetical protein PLU07_04685 [Ferruginibacter sp.]|nr:hypothetical protein [Ferruginibacter sp.]